MDFRDHAIKKALDESVRPYRPERTRRARLTRVAAIVVLALVTSVAFITIVNRSTPRHAPAAPDRKPVPIELIAPSPARP